MLNLFSPGKIDVNTCISKDALIFGKIPSEKIPKINCLPCENVLRSDKIELPFRESYR